MQCGPIRYRLSEKQATAATAIEHTVIPRHTSFRLPHDLVEPGIQEIYRLLVADEQRNELIVADLLRELEAGRSPLLLTERTEHLQLLAAKLQGIVPQIVELKGGMSGRQRQEVMERLRAMANRESRVILATGRSIGEGFDDPRLDTLLLAMPISWRGTLQQYVGRLHRMHDNKRIVRVYDYVDGSVAMLARMYEKRVGGYKAIGYSIER
jgi:superfamily II DNA or RNA helicase